MAKVHVLQGDRGRYTCIIHYLVPNGSNSASITWKNVILGAGLNKTVMTEGTGAGQISTAEKGQITAGDVVEVSTNLEIDSTGGDASQLLPEINRIINEDKSRIAAAYKWYGRAEGAVN